jgi:energy-coupling factor transporter ATP-binding protein EcfA2
MALPVKVHPHEQWTTRGSPYGESVLAPTPCRYLLVGPSGSGKSVLLVDFLVRLYRGAFQRIYVFSPSIFIDSAWKPVFRYVENTLGVDSEREQWAFDEWEDEKLKEIVETQKAVIQEQKHQKAGKELYGIAIVVDDFADDPRVMASRSGASAGGSMLNTLLVRGRHMQISTFMSVQKLRLAGSILRVNAQAICVFRLRNKLELDAIVEELSAVYSKEQLLEMYELATREPYSFWYVYLAATRKEDMFFLRFDKRLTPAISAPSGKGIIHDHGSFAASPAASAPSTQQPRL